MGAEYFAIFYLLRRRNISFISRAFEVTAKSLFRKQVNLPLIKSDYLVVSGISFHKYPVPPCAFLFLSTCCDPLISSPLSSPYASASITRHLSSRTILVQNAIDIPSRAHSQHMLQQVLHLTFD